jgi:recombinational DNA repair protein (RecF pathway)
MAESLSLDREPCIVLSVVPYNDGRRVVRVLGETLGTVALWVTEGRGKNRQVGKWHP